jgi:hypothetical protein
MGQHEAAPIGQSFGSGGFAAVIDDQPETVVLADHGYDLAFMDHADLDALVGDLDAAAAGHPPLHRSSGTEPSLIVRLV